SPPPPQAFELPVRGERRPSEQGRELEAEQSVPVAAERDVTTAELAQRLQDEAPQPGPDAPAVEGKRFQVGVARLLAEELGQIGVVIVDERLGQVAGRSIELDQLVDETAFVVAGPTASEQSQLLVRVPARVPYPASTDQVVARDPEADGLAGRFDRPADLGRQLRSHDLVGVHEQYPGTAG